MVRQARVTIREIARMCGVSTQTVSRVMNRRPDVSLETRAAVEAAIAATGYRPSAVARSLVQRRSRTLGVIVAGLKFVGVSQVLNGITEATQASDYALLLKELPRQDSTDVVSLFESFIAHQVEGIIFAAPQVGRNVEVVQRILPFGSPPIVFLKAKPAEGFVTIDIDNRGGARQATEHLIALGRTRIAHVAGPLDWLEARDRRDGWSAALRDAELDPGPCVEGNWSSASGLAAFEEILATNDRIDGLFAANDQMALGVLHGALRRGTRVPDDLALVGFDDLAEASFYTPSLTTVSQPLRDLGKLAVGELLRLIDAADGNLANVGQSRTIDLPTALVVRDSAPRPGVLATPTVRSATEPPAIVPPDD